MQAVIAVPQPIGGKGANVSAGSVPQAFCQITSAEGEVWRLPAEWSGVELWPFQGGAMRPCSLRGCFPYVARSMTSQCSPGWVAIVAPLGKMARVLIANGQPWQSDRLTLHGFRFGALLVV